MNEDRSARYHRLKRRSSVLSAVLAAAGLIAVLASGASVQLREISAALSGAGPAAVSTVVVYVLLLVVLEVAIDFPVAWYRSFTLERRFGLSTERFATWAGDYAKGAGVRLLLAEAAGAIIYASITHWPRTWWAVSSLAFIGGLAVLACAAPVVLLPIFYRFRPLDREALRTRLLTLSARAGLPVLGVYEWGLGEKTRRANAVLVGTGPTRRVLLSDTLLAEYSDDEIEVILAHELGHHAHGDIVTGIAIESVLIVAAFRIAALALERWGPVLGLVSAADVAGLPLLFLIAAAVSLTATPAMNALSRRNERRADRYALAMTRRPGAFVSALRRLGAQNLAEESPSTAALWLFHTHPPLEQRIRWARSFETTQAQGAPPETGDRLPLAR